MRRDVFQAIADPTRRAIITLLAAQAMTPNALALQFNTSRQAVSKHLRILTECRLVTPVQQGREIYYKLEGGKMKEVDKWLEQFRKIWENRFTELDNILSNLKTETMNSNLLFEFSVDKEKNEINVKREFSAGLDLVWKAWTTPSLLDQWWAPRPYRNETKLMDFSEGGHWLYSMSGPDGDRHWCRHDYENIENLKSFSGPDAFCDENGIINTDFPQSFWNNIFTPAGELTVVDITITFSNLEDLEKIIDMGFKEGFTMGLQNLDELLEKLT